MARASNDTAYGVLRTGRAVEVVVFAVAMLTPV
jgi:hypothetical protein